MAPVNGVCVMGLRKVNCVEVIATSITVSTWRIVDVGV